jgi:glucose-6-phosphate isomerase
MGVAEIWAQLAAEAQALAGVHMRQVFADDPARFSRFSATACGITLDYSKNRLNSAAFSKLLELARESGLAAKRDAMFAGEAINSTEGRAVLHVALRAPQGARFSVGGQDVMGEVLAERARCLAFAEDVREGRITAFDGKPFTAIVNIGIGGSDLGPAMAAQALAPFAKPGLGVHFVSNVDGAHLADTLKGLDAARTLIIVSSKTFTTLETMMNARSARAWIAAKLGEGAVAAQFAAVSTNLSETAKFGIASARVFRFWDWVGGRYSVWSAIGVSLMIAIGQAHFSAFLAGAHAMDAHFRHSPLEGNLPVLLGLIGIWNRNVLGHASFALLPYDQRLARMPAWLQQGDMESNGKQVKLDGSPVDGPTGPVVWGEPGTNGQHAFYQLLHQGTDPVPADFLIAAQPVAADVEHHRALVANALAQTEALMRGRTLAEALAQGASPDLAPHKVFPGNRPSNTLVYSQLDPAMLGSLLALYEHKIFVQGAIWGINSFDQWGVELGKELASRLSPILEGKAAGAELDGSSLGLIGRLRELGLR